MHTDPDELLPQHQHLLLVDSTKLARGRLSDRQTWITRMEAAVSAKERLIRDVQGLEGDAPHERTEEDEDNEGLQGH